MEKRFRRRFKDTNYSGEFLGLAEYIYKECSRSDSRGNIYLDIPDDFFEDYVKEYYDSYLRSPLYNKVVDALNKVAENDDIKMYNGYIQLDDRRMLWEIDGDVDIDNEEWWYLVDSALENLEEETGVEFFYDGRSNRHVVVKNTIENFLRAPELREKLLIAEDKLIDFVNENYKYGRRS